MKMQNSTITQQYTIVPYTLLTDTVDHDITDYSGNIETHFSSSDSTTWRRIHNTIGYHANNTYYHYLKDHLGNICAVVNSPVDTVVQQTMYYASGVPLPSSTGRDEQPYLYNGKEFIEAHGWNTYDYGFRGYYATIGRFTSIDPLAEQTPWLPPYSYAGNNFINNIDWMGLASGAYTTSDPNKIAELLSYLAGGGSLNDYDPEGWEDITNEIEDYMRKHVWLFPIESVQYSYAGPGAVENTIDVYVIATAQPTLNAKSKDLYDNILRISKDAIDAGGTGANVWLAAQRNPCYWIGENGKLYTSKQIHTRGGYAYSFQQKGINLSKSPVGTIGRGLGYASIFLSGIDIYNNGLGAGTAISVAMTCAGIWGAEYGLAAAVVYGLTDLGFLIFSGSSLTETLNEKYTLIERFW